MELHLTIALGSSTGIVPNREELMESLQILKPTNILSVPTLYNKIYDGVMSKVRLGKDICGRGGT